MVSQWTSARSTQDPAGPDQSITSVSASESPACISKGSTSSSGGAESCTGRPSQSDRRSCTAGSDASRLRAIGQGHDHLATFGACRGLEQSRPALGRQHLSSLRVDQRQHAIADRAARCQVEPLDRLAAERLHRVPPQRGDPAQRGGPRDTHRATVALRICWAGRCGGPSFGSVLVAREVTRHHGGQVVLDAVTLSVPPRARYGVVGPNGIGKSTLLRILAGVEEPDGGVVERSPAALTVGWMPQEPDAGTDETLAAYLARRTGVAAAAAEPRRCHRGPLGGARGHRGARRGARPLPGAGRRRPRVARRGDPRARRAAGGPDRRGRRGPLGRPGVARRSGRPAPQPLRRAPARRAHQRPRLRGARTAGVHPCRYPGRAGDGQPRPRLPRPRGRADRGAAPAAP